MVKGYCIFTPVFENVTPNANGESKLNIQDLVLKGDSVVGEGSDEFIQIVNSDGSFGDKYVWYAEATIDGEYFPACWGDDEANPIEREIALGEGFYIFTRNAGVQLQTSGAVKLEKLTKNLNAGYNMAGNATPVEIDIQDIILKGDNIVGEGSDEFIQIINSDGSFGDKYVWYAEATIDGEYFPACWGDDEANPIEMTVKAGEAFYIFVRGAGISYEIKSLVQK